MSQYISTIGLEFHAELKTKTKIFCSCPTKFSDQPNTQVCPVCLGLPGVLPVLNKHAVELAVKAGLALHCQISPLNKFDRKNYFYPDLPKGYQVTQYPLPVCREGYIIVQDAEGRDKKVRINRIHLEEDAGKLVHSGDSIADSDYSLADYNRAAVPLIEIVSEPDMSSAEEARDFGEKLRLILAYAQVSDVKMEQGSLRCDVNISLRPREQQELGVKVEIKNLNSFKAVYRAIKYEEQRQQELLSQGQTIVQETRLWDEASGETKSMRSKENAHDYRYFPEPDLPPVILSPEWIAGVAATLPELPDAKTARLQKDLGLSAYDSRQIVANPPLARLFDQTAALTKEHKTLANWLLGDISRLLNEAEQEYEQVPLAAEDLAYLLEQVKSGAVNNNSAKIVLEEMFTGGKKPADIIAAHGFAQISDASFLADAVAAVIAANPQPAADYRAGKKQAVGFLVGQVMKQTKGQANPGMVRDLLEKTLSAPDNQ
ncbi:MAG: Asp-tRNA(Asn)/Glu-tRNA(Gln) amidotransferase subunit GatB [Firmicutes bacterium]|nr:Asp-tRNA(Asn)/Glu-tRNA(Gln) amidotransferase subunit GatB [Bacillota bacterium]